MNLKIHWNDAYKEGERDVSWYQEQPALSLRLIEGTRIGKDEGIIDVGGGASLLVDHLLDAGFRNLAVLDLSGVALRLAQQRLATRADSVKWFEVDVTNFEPPQQFSLWHDRAVFHFLTQEADRRKYVRTLLRTVSLGGHVIIATFAKDGPLKCSGLEVARYDAASICAELGQRLKFAGQADESHVTPWNTEQKFSYFRFQLQPQP